MPHLRHTLLDALLLGAVVTRPSRRRRRAVVRVDIRRAASPVASARPEARTRGTGCAVVLLVVVAALAVTYWYLSLSLVAVAVAIVVVRDPRKSR